VLLLEGISKCLASEKRSLSLFSPIFSYRCLYSASSPLWGEGWGEGEYTIEPFARGRTTSTNQIFTMKLMKTMKKSRTRIAADERGQKGEEQALE